MEMLNKAVNHIKQFPSRASDADTHPQEQTGKYIITRTVNQMNLKMDLSDYQVILGLLDLLQIITSETYTYSNTVADMGYCTNMQLAANKKSAEQKHLQQLEHIRDEEEMAEAHNIQEFNNFIVDDSTDYSCWKPPSLLSNVHF